MRDLIAGILLGLTLLAAPAARAASFTDAEREAVVRYWYVPGRSVTALPDDAAKAGPVQVRLTTEGSAWLWRYQRAVAGPGKLPPTVDLTASVPHPDWETWVRAKLESDRWQAQNSADTANGAFGIVPSAPGVPPPAPGPIPTTLLQEVGAPPPFAGAVTPLVHVVTFDDGQVYRLPDHAVLRPRYAYYRFAQGVVSYGRQLREMTDAELDPLFAGAGLNPFEQRVMKAVSKLEGGFDAVNTYDTGFVSIGFIQFTTGENGTGSLLEVLAREKTDAPDDFQRDLRRFGIDVDAGTLVIVDPGTGAELRGRDAVQKVIDEPRLVAAFQRAGQTSTAFRVAQIKVAKSHYWALEDPLTVTVNGEMLQGKVSDVIRSEAGAATLFDRKVNRGSVAPLADVIAKVMTDHNLKTLADAAAYEREIVAAVKYRTDFLAESSLAQPPAPPVQ